MRVFETHLIQNDCENLDFKRDNTGKLDYVSTGLVIIQNQQSGVPTVYLVKEHHTIKKVKHWSSSCKWTGVEN